MKKHLSKIISEIDTVVLESNRTDLKIVEELQDYYFNKLVVQNIKLYKKKKKKVSEITKELKISHRRFYAILDQKKIAYTKYNKNKEEHKNKNSEV